MNDPKSTNDIRMIAQEVTHQQAELCESRRDNLEDKQAANATMAASNAAAIAMLTTQVATLLTSVAVLKGHPGIWAAIGSAAPVALGFVLWWFNK